MEDPILQPLPLEAVVVDPGREACGGDGGGDLQVIRDVLSVHHVPVVASLHWDKLHSILHSLCDNLASQAVRLEKTEEQGKTFLSFKDDLDVLCRNAVKEMKEARESELEQQQNWSKMVEERLQSLQQGMDANNNDIKQLQMLDNSVQSFAPRLDALEAATHRLDAVEAATKELEAFHATQPISLESLNTKLDELLMDFEEQNEKLHTLEEQNEQLKLRLEQTIKSHSSDLEALQQYCRNLRSDFELKFLVDVGKMPNAAEGEFSPTSKSKLEAAVAELQNRIQKKADADEINKISQSTQNVKDAFEKMESNVVELQSQMKRMYAPRRSTRMSMNVGFLPQDNQRLARYVKEQLERPENAIFTTKPLYGFKCMSCDHSVEKLSPLAGDHVPTNRMPPQILPMLSAERIFAFDRRRSSPFPGQTTGTRAQRVMSMRKTSPRKSPL